MVDVNLAILVITLSVNELNNAIKGRDYQFKLKKIPTSNSSWSLDSEKQID